MTDRVPLKRQVQDDSPEDREVRHRLVTPFGDSLACASQKVGNSHLIRKFCMGYTTVLLVQVFPILEMHWVTIHVHDQHLTMFNHRYLVSALPRAIVPF